MFFLVALPVESALGRPRFFEGVVITGLLSISSDAEEVGEVDLTMADAALPSDSGVGVGVIETSRLTAVMLYFAEVWFDNAKCRYRTEVVCVWSKADASGKK